jgi:hypothetical protein
LKSISFGIFFETPVPNNVSTACEIFSNGSMVVRDNFVNISRMEKNAKC